MKYIFLLLASTASFAATLPPWALEAKSREIPREFEKAEAIVLVHDVTLEPAKPGFVAATHRCAIKIMRKEGSLFADVVVHHREGDWLRELKGWYQEPDGDVVKVGRRQSREGSCGTGQVDDWRRTRLPLGNGESGSIVAYTYTVEEKTVFGTGLLGFNRVVPSLYIRVCPRGGIQTVLSFDWNGKAMKRGPCHTWHNVPEYEREAWSPAEMDLSPRLLYALEPVTWDGLASAYLAEAPLPDGLSVDSTLESGRLDFKKFASLLDRLRSEVRYAAVELGDGAFVPTSPAETLKRQWGDCKDKSYLIIAVLRELGVPAWPVLTKHTSDGKVEPEAPSLAQFNHVITAIKLPDSWTDGLKSVSPSSAQSLFFFDPTDEIGPLHLLPETLQGAGALLIHPSEPRYLSLPVAPTDANRQLIKSTIRLSDGEAIIDVEERSWGSYFTYEKRCFHAKTAEECEEIMRNYVEELIPGADLVGFRLEKNEGDEPFLLSFKVKKGSFLRKLGDLLVCQPIFARKMAANPFQSNERTAPVTVRVNRRSEQEVVLDLPDTLTVEELPDEKEIDTELFSYSLKVELENGVIKVRRSFITRKGMMGPNRATELREAFGKIVRSDGSTILLKKIQ